MKKILNLLILFALSICTHAQVVSGQIKDEINSPLANVTINLLNTKDSLIKFQVTNAEGHFTFHDITAGVYKISVSHIGFEDLVSEVFTLDSTKLFPPITLKKTSRELSEVVVTTKKPLIQVKGDRTIINIEGSINATGNNVLELLRKSPGVTLNGQNISLNGKNGVRIYIDGRLSPLSDGDLTAFLQSISSSNVEAIELITNPSSKFEAAGNAGIINIRLKKLKSFGTNGALNVDYRQGIHSRFNTGMSFNHRNAKLNVYGSYNYNEPTFMANVTLDRLVSDTAFNQQGIIFNDTKSHNIKMGTDFFINKKSTIGFMALGNFVNDPIDINSTTAISFKPNNEIIRTFDANNELKATKNQMNFSLDYNFKDTNGKVFQLTADYGFYDVRSSQNQRNIYRNISGALLETVEFEMATPANIDIYSIMVDYERPLLKGKLSLGAKSSFVQTINDFRSFNIIGGNKQLDLRKSNYFIYKELVNAGYLHYNKKWKQLEMEMGVRAEHTNIDANSKGVKEDNGQNLTFDSSIKRKYINLFPSAAFNYSANEYNNFTISISRRIDRPAYRKLNPFEIIIDDYAVQKGNPYLRPQFTSSISMGWVYKDKLNASIEYSKMKDVAIWIKDTTEKSKVLIINKNIEDHKLISSTVSYPFEFKNYEAFTSLTANYIKFNGDFGPGRVINESALLYNIYIQNTYKLSKKWKAELSGFYNSPKLDDGNLKIKAIWSVDAGLQTKALKEKATVKFSISDIFKSMVSNGTSIFAGQTYSENYKMDTRQVKLSINFRLGSKEIKNARERKSASEQEIDRL